VCVLNIFLQRSAICSLPYVYDCKRELCRKKAEVVKHHESDNAKPDIENIRPLNLAVIKLTAVQVTKVPL
jgi:hypothetical protein